MPGATFTFRCPECRKLLAVSRSRVGTAVVCPKCQSDLIVPEPGDNGGPGPGEVTQGSGFVHVPSESQPADPIPTSPPGSTSTPRSGSPSFFPPIELEDDPLSLRPNAGSRTYKIPDRAPVNDVDPQSGTAQPKPSTVDPPPTQVLESPGFPLIQTQPDLQPLAPDSRRSEPIPAPRRNDVVMPRTALVLWSFVMLVALVFAFAAGLLAGHFLWKPHTLAPPSSSTATKPSTASADQPVDNTNA